jgi:hypothetical protein
MQGTAPRKPKLGIVVAVFAILSVIFMGISLGMPWYSHTAKSEAMGISFETEQLYKFEGIEMENPLTDEVETVSWDDEDLGNTTNTKNVYQTTQILVILGLVMGILLLIGGILAFAGKGKKLAVLFGLLAFLFCLLAPVLFMFMHPGAVDEDIGEDIDFGPQKSFIGSRSETEGEGEFSFSVEENWGPGTGWFMAMVGFVFAIVGFGLALRLPKPVGAPMPPPGPEPGPGPGTSQPPQPPRQQYGYSQPPPPPRY